ncbi:aromatic acid decarboxylase [Ignicoccus islandicus DSM 13165]|uniref:Aromatic acid decarboxylase n=1 Tax=Ignicoccus islandicus DSM 13165 TaxID=940295 RepID=A0A0U3F6H8_9CREN|nr:UbiX family flavin prenyltransferase [Ignicoccus islandicus]ALU11672.1 aromatic acid decarboxylase [Ignicoccus islandicus DSM 13165]
MKIVVGITGASGLPLSSRLIDVLRQNSNIHVHVVASEGALLVAREEPCTYPDLKPCDLVKYIKSMGVGIDVSLSSMYASSSNVPDKVVIVPASMKSVASISLGLANTLPTRVALNALRMGRELVLVPRETPLGSIELGHLYKLSTLGVKIVPPIPAFYPNPSSILDIIDFIVGKILDVMKIDHNLYKRYKH